MSRYSASKSLLQLFEQRKEGRQWEPTDIMPTEQHVGGTHSRDDD